MQICINREYFAPKSRKWVYCYSIWFCSFWSQFWREKWKVLRDKTQNFLKMIFWIILLVLVGFAQSCPKVCLCSLEKTTCYFTRCSDAVPLSETSMLEIHGPICNRQRQILADQAFHNTIKWFLDDTCLNVPNCW